MKMLETLLFLGEKDFGLGEETAAFMNIEEMFSPLNSPPQNEKGELSQKNGDDIFSADVVNPEIFTTNNRFFEEQHQDSYMDNGHYESYNNFFLEGEKNSTALDWMTTALTEQTAYSENNSDAFFFLTSEDGAKSCFQQNREVFEREKNPDFFDTASETAFGVGENELKKEVHIHNEIPSIRIEFSGSIDQSVDVDALMRDMQKRLKEEMEAGTDFYYRG